MSSLVFVCSVALEQGLNFVLFVPYLLLTLGLVISWKRWRGSIHSIVAGFSLIRSTRRVSTRRVSTLQKNDK